MSRAEAEGKVKDSSVQPLKGTKVLDTQVGGHRYGNNGKKIGKLNIFWSSWCSVTGAVKALN